MKKIIIIVIMALVATTFFTGFTSVENSAADTVRPIQTLRQNWLIDSSLLFTPRDTNFQPSKPGFIWFEAAKNFYKWDMHKWSVLSSDTSSTDLSNYWTSTQVQNRLDDTAAAIRADFPTGGSTDLSAYSTTAQTKQLIGDTATTVRAAIPTANGGLENTAGYQTKDSLTAHAVTVNYPLFLLNSTLNVDTSGVDSSLVTHHQLDSTIAALPAGGGSGITKIGQGWGLSKVNDSTNRVDSSKVTSVQALRDSIAILMDSISNLRTSVVIPTLEQVTNAGNFSDVLIAFTGGLEVDGLAAIDVESSPVLQTDGNGHIGPADSVNNYVTPTALRNSIAAVSVLPNVPITNLTGTAYTASLAYKHHIVVISNSSAITVTIPASTDTAFSVGDVLEFIQGGAGQITFTGAAGVTVGNAHSYTKSAAKYSIVSLRKIDTDTWVLFGDLQ